MGTTVRRISGTGGDRIVVRNHFRCDQSMEVTQDQVNTAARSDDRSFHNRFGILKDVSMEYRWGGRLCVSRNNVSAFGELDDGLFSACCQNGLGAARGTLGGVLAAELGCGETSEPLDLLLKEAKPVRLPPAALTEIGANLKIRLDERKAGREL